MGRCSTSLVIRQVKNIIRKFYFSVSWVAVIKRDNNVLMKMCRNWNPCTLLVGVQNGSAILENSLEVPQKVKQSSYDPEK